MSKTLPQDPDNSVGTFLLFRLNRIMLFDGKRSEGHSLSNFGTPKCPKKASLYIGVRTCTRPGFCSTTK